MKKTQAASVPVIQVNNVLKNRNTKETTAHETMRRVSEEFYVAKAEGKNFIRIYVPGKELPIFAPVKVDGTLTARGRRMREQFLEK